MAPHSEYYTAIAQPFPDGEGTIKDLVQERIRASSPGWVPSCGMPGCGDDAKVSSLKMLEGHHCANPIASQVSGGVLVGSLFWPRGRSR